MRRVQLARLSWVAPRRPVPRAAPRTPWQSRASHQCANSHLEQPPQLLEAPVLVAQARQLALLVLLEPSQLSRIGSNGLAASSDHRLELGEGEHLDLAAGRLRRNIHRFTRPER